MTSIPSTRPIIMQQEHQHSISKSRMKPHSISTWVQWEELQNLETLGQGSMCKIFSCTWRGNSNVVIKMVREDCPDPEVSMNDLELELQVLRQLSHANIVGMLGAGMHPRKGRFLLLERLTGGTLTDVLKREHIRLEVQQPPQLRKTGGMSLRARLGQERSTKRTLLDALTLPNSRSRLSGSRKSGSGEGEREGRIEPPTVAWLAQVVRWGLQIADAMHYMHHEAKHGYLLLHRDLKPDNIAFTKSANHPGTLELKLIDFGLSKLVKKRPAVNILARYRMTGETGSPRYMAPECHLNLPYNEKVDVYSFGMCLWEMVELEPPFIAFKDLRHFRQSVVLGGGRPPLAKENWPPSLSNLVSSCWSRDIDARPAFDEVINRLNEILARLEEAQSCAPEPSSPLQRSGRSRRSFQFARSLSPVSKHRCEDQVGPSGPQTPKKVLRLPDTPSTVESEGFHDELAPLTPVRGRGEDEDEDDFRVGRALSAPDRRRDSQVSVRESEVINPENDMGRRKHKVQRGRSIAKIQATFARIFSMSGSKEGKPRRSVEDSSPFGRLGLSPGSFGRKSPAEQQRRRAATDLDIVPEHVVSPPLNDQHRQVFSGRINLFNSSGDPNSTV